MSHQKLAAGFKGKTYYIICKNHFGFSTTGRLECYARYALRGKTGEQYLKLYKESGKGRFPVTLFGGV